METDLSTDPEEATTTHDGSALVQPRIVRVAGWAQTADRGPCRDYDSDCDDMTMEEIAACHGNPGLGDDRCGYCVMKLRSN